MKPLEVWTCQRAENLKKKSSKISKKLRSNNGIDGAPTNYRRRRRADQQKPAAAPTNCRRRRRGTAGAQLYPQLIRTYNYGCIIIWLCLGRNPTFGLGSSNAIGPERPVIAESYMTRK